MGLQSSRGGCAGWALLGLGMSSDLSRPGQGLQDILCQEQGS